MAYPITNPIFQPALRTIYNITNANPALVVTTQPHLYITGTVVRIDTPPGFGMQQINQLFGTIVVNSSNSFFINIDTTLFDVFSMPETYPYNSQQAQSVPIGEDNSILTAAVQNTLPH